MNTEIVYRKATAADRGFIAGNMHHHYAALDRETADRVIDEALATSESWVAECDGVLISCVVVQPPYVVYCYTKSLYRKLGIARELLRQSQGRYKPILAKTLPRKEQIRRKFKPGTGCWVYE